MHDEARAVIEHWRVVRHAPRHGGVAESGLRHRS